jgi:hypothetical protein
MPDVSISIVNYHSTSLLLDCLESLYSAGGNASFEVIVVENGSNDGSAETIRAAYPQVRLIVLDANTGYTRPMNEGLRAGNGHFLMQLNPDTLVRPGLLDELLAFMEKHPEAGICTPKVLNRDGTLQRQCRRSAARPWDVITYFSGLARLFPRSRLFGRYLMTYQAGDELHEAEAVSGSCMLIRRTVIDQIGYLDELFFAYQEDADFCFRARKAGWKIFFVPAAQIIHFGGQGGSRVEPYRAIYHWHRSYFLYYRKHLAADYFFLVNWGMYALMGLKLGAALLVNFLRKEKIVGTRKP